MHIAYSNMPPPQNRAGPYDLSIVNRDRRILRGPRLLHELITDPPEERIILDFLQADDCRTELTYKDFHRITDLLAQAIRSQVTAKKDAETIIPVIIPQCPELYVAWVAVLKSGATLCPVSHDVPPERLKFILQDVDATYVLATSSTSASFRDALSDIKCQVVSLMSLQARLQSLGADGLHPQPQPSIDPSSPAYVMYTSGSTGQPKGVMISHFAVSQSLLAHDEQLPRFKRFLQFASPTFDVSIFEVFFPFFRGATLVGCERERMLADLPATIRSLDADAAELTPTVAGTLLRTREAAPCLKMLLTIGEMLTPQVVSEFGGDQDRPSMLYAMYGPTEAAIHCTVAPTLGSNASVRRIGRPLATVTAFVLRDSGSPAIAPIAESGELAIAGQLADGYLNRPEQNRAAFIELPGYGPVYKTGDRAICRPDGELEILGRMSSGQVKLRGQRVELGEIEEVASSTKGVRLAIASIIDDILVLFCVAHPDVEADDIRAHCKSWLPPFMRPAEIILIMEDVPRLASGKIDRNGLEHLYRSQRASNYRASTFKNRAEEDIAKALSTELGIEFDRSTSFWSLGLDSLRAIKIAAQLRHRYSSVSATILTDADNIAELALLLTDQTSSDECGSTEVDYEASEEWQVLLDQLHKDTKIAEPGMSWEKILPCSSMQVAMLVETAMNTTQNFNDIWLQLAAGVTLADLRRAFKKLAEKNEILRSGFVPTSRSEMSYVQVVWPELAGAEISLLRPFQLSQDDADEAVHVRIHHALYDGWSWDVILDGLNAILCGENVPTNTSFSAFRSFEQNQSQSDASANREYWEGQFLCFKPSAFPNLSATRSDQKCGNSFDFPLSMTYQDLSSFASSLHCSRETVLEAAWSLLLTSYVNETDVTMGIVSAGRHHAVSGIESIIGPCLSMLPLRVDIGTLRTAHDLLNHIQRQRNECVKHSNIKLRDINAAAGLSAGEKLFDTLCVWQQDSEDDYRNRSKVSTIGTDDALDYAIVLEFEPRQGKVHLKLTFDSNRIPEAQANLLARQLDETTTQIMNNLDATLKRVCSQTNSKVMSVANIDFNHFSESFDLTSTIRGLANSDPERVAVEFVHGIEVSTNRMDKTILTYGDLFNQASTIASALMGKYDVQVDDLVCLIGPRSIQLYIGILGVIMAGGAYICVDPRTPIERTRSILTEAKCQLVLTVSNSSHLDGPEGVISVPVSDLLAQGSVCDSNSHPHLTGDELAYAVFTSGSTGIPKGVLLTRRNLLSNLEELSRIYPCGPQTGRLLQSCSPAFDVAVFEIFWTWHMGMTLCTASNDVLFRDLELFIRKMNITHLSMTPSVAALVRPDKVPLVKMLVTAGEPMNSKVFSAWADRGLFQGYGPSETTNICSVRPRVSHADALDNVGPPLPNTSVFICERQSTKTSGALNRGSEPDPLEFKLVPKGGAGEIWIGGEQVGRGYIDPVLTAKSFLDHQQYGRLYRSGDMGRLLADGSLVILGREDDQVKLRGQRIELGEVNSALVRSEGVEDAVTMVIGKDGEAAARLVAFWTPRSSEASKPPTAANMAIYDLLSDVLPSYMIPDALIRLDQLPLTRQGKVDRKNLAAYYEDLSAEQLEAVSRAKTSSEDLDDLNDDERSIAQSISDLLGVRLETITRNISFYGLGLDSISAIHVGRRLRDRFPSIEVSTLLRNPSIGQLHRFLSSNAENSKHQLPLKELAWNPNDPLWNHIHDIYAPVGLEVEKIMPCTPLQESMATTSMNASFQAYQNTMRFEVCGDIQKMREAWDLALVRHQILRTGFITTESADQPIVQVVLKNFRLPWVDGRSRNLGRLDVGGLAAPPWSLTLNRNGSTATELTLQMHHCLYDAEAMAVLLSEIEACYHGHDLPPQGSFDSYLSFMDASNTTETYEFWHSKLDGASLCKLSDAVLPGDKIPAGTSQVIQRIATIRLSAFQRFAQRISSTPLAIVQAAWSRLLFCIFQTQDVCFGNVLSGRNLPIDGIDRVVAPCFNTLPMRARLSREGSNQDLCRDLQHMNIEILPFQPSSLRRIQREVDTRSRNLFDTLILLQQDQLRLDHDIWTLIDESGDMSFPFILEVVMSADDNAISLRLHSEVAGQHILKPLLDAFDSLLVHTTQYPQARASDYSSITPVLPELQPVAPVTVRGDTLVTNGMNGSIQPEEELSATEKAVEDILVSMKPDIRQSIYKDTTIFHLGFDSINAVQIAARLRKKGFELSSGDVLEAATIRNIAGLCDSRAGAPLKSIHFDLNAFDREHRQAICEASDIDRPRVQHVWPCTPTQSGILSQYLRSNRVLYFNHIHFRLEPGVEIWRLQRAWARAMKIHKMLRAGFAEMDDPKTPFAMIIYKTGAMQLPWVDDATAGPQVIPELQHLQWSIRISSSGSSRILDLSILHAIYDARSLDIILDDVACLYARNHSQKVQVDLATTLSKILAVSSEESSKSFWSELSNDLRSTRFPDMSVYKNKAQKLGVTILRSSMTNDCLQQACVAAGATVQAMIATAWALLLSSYTAQDRVTFGVILSGRVFDEEENDVAFPCISTVPLAVETTTGNGSLLKDVTHRCAGVLKHQHTPLNSIKRWAGIEGELFDSVIVLQKYGDDQNSQAPWTLVKDDAAAEYTVSLEVLPRKDGAIDLQLTFRGDIVPPQQAQEILEQYDATLKNTIAPPADDSNFPESMLSVVPANEARIPTRISYLHKFVETTARSKPNGIALEFVTSLEGTTAAKQTWTYSELDAHGNRIARLIQIAFAKVGELVAICFDKCPEASFAILGVLKAGCGYLAIDPGAPLARKEFILQDSNCRLVLTTKDKVAEFRSFPNVSALAIDDSDWRSLSPERVALTRRLDSQDTCYCLYTSGTTGTPKGCLISHDSAVQAMMSFQRIFRGRWNDSSRWLQFASFHFDVSVLEQYWSWSVGICLTSAPRDLLFEDLPGTINALKITHLDLTPSLARLLTPKDVPNLCDGVFIVGGEQVRQDILETWGDTGCLYNFYGPSEVTIGCTVHRQVPKNAKPSNIGQQWDNVGSFVLQPNSQQVVLRGAVGELCLSGPLVGKGYLNRPELSAEKFVKLVGYDTRVYRTGDLVRLLHDDSFEFLGRIDGQVKLRGQRLEIGEINHLVVAVSPTITDVATLVLKHPTQQKEQLVTFFSTARRKAKHASVSIVTDDSSRYLAGKIRESCFNSLPAYMVPTHILAVSYLPLSVNNKADYKALRVLYEETSGDLGERPSDESDESTPENPELSNKVAEILASFLQIPMTSVKSNSRLFELGLDSISAIGLARAFKKQGLQNVDVAMILRQPTVRDLAHALVRQPPADGNWAVEAALQRIRSFAGHHRTAVAKALKVQLGDIEHVAPCTPLQEGMISKVMRSASDDTVYFSCFRSKLSPAVDVARLEAAWHLTQRSISILRTFFVSTADGYAQAVLHKCPAKINRITSDRIDGVHGRHDASFKEWVRSVKSLSTSLPWAAELITSGSGAIMNLYLFHGLYDGISVQLLLQQLKRHYERPAEAPASTMQFYQALPHGPLCVLPNEKDFWSSCLPSFNPLKLTLTTSKSDISDENIVLKDSCVYESLQTLCNKMDVTTSAFFQGLFLYALHKQFRTQPSVGIVVSGRALTHEGLEDVIGPMFNTIPFAVNGLKKGETIADLIRACHKFNVDAIPYQHTPLRKIAQYIGQDINRGLFDALFVFQKSSTDVEGDALWEEVPTDSSPDYPLNIEIEQKGTHFTITVVAKSAYLSERDVKQLLATYLNAIRDPTTMESILPAELCRKTATVLPNGLQTHTGPSDQRQDETHFSEAEITVRSQIAQLASVQDTAVHLDGPTIFELGLDSIEAMKLVARLKNAGLRIAVSAIMQAPTVAGIAQAASSATDAGSTPTDERPALRSLTDLQPDIRTALHCQGVNLDEIEYILPVTPMQEGLLLESDMNLNVMIFRLAAGTKMEKLFQALEMVSKMEPILRIRFATIDATKNGAAFFQYVLKHKSPVTTIKGRKVRDVISSLRNVPAEQDLSTQKMQFTLVNDDEMAFLLLTTPHALYDAWSMHLLQQQVREAYHAPFSVQANATSSRAIQNHLEQVINHSHSHQENGFWEQQLTDIQPTTLRPNAPKCNSAFLLQQQSGIQSTDVTNFCKSQGVTLQSLGLACLTIVLAHYTRQLDVCFGLVLAGRTTEDSERLIFPTFNTVVFRPQLKDDDTRAHALKQVHNAVVRVSEYQHFPLRDTLKIVRGQGIEEEIFNTLFTFQKLPSSENDLEAIYHEVSPDQSNINPPYPVNIEFEGGEDGLVWTVAFQARIANEAFGHELIGKLDNIMSELMKRPEQLLMGEEDNNAMICGLPGIELRHKESQKSTASTDFNRPEIQYRTPESWTSTELIVRDVFANISKVDKEQIRKNTGIFHLGLDSVSAIRVASLLRKRAVCLPVSAIIREHTVGNIAAQAEKLRSYARADRQMLDSPVINEVAVRAVRRSISLPEADIEAIMPAAGGQIYMLDMWRASRGRLFYPTFWLSVSNCSPETFKQAVKELTRSVPILRTLFIHHKGIDMPETWQVILKDRVIDKYDLPWSVHVENQGDGLLVTLRMHHALYDAVNLQLLLSELERLCSNTSERRQPTTNMASFLSGTRSPQEESRRFWTNYLGIRRTSVQQVSRGSFARSRVEILDPRLLPTSQLYKRLRCHGLGIQALFFVAYAKLYSSICRNTMMPQKSSERKPQDVVIGVYLANRSLEIEGITELIAPTLNIVPLRVQLEGKTLLESALQVQHDLAGIGRVENCGASLADIYSWTGIKVDTFVNFLSLPDNAGEKTVKDPSDKKVRINHAELNPGQKINLQDLTAPSPFVKDMKYDLDTVEWCLVSSPTFRTFSAPQSSSEPISTDSSLTFSLPSISRQKWRMEIWQWASSRRRICFPKKGSPA